MEIYLSKTGSQVTAPLMNVITAKLKQQKSIYLNYSFRSYDVRCFVDDLHYFSHINVLFSMVPFIPLLDIAVVILFVYSTICVLRFCTSLRISMIIFLNSNSGEKQLRKLAF